MKWGFLVLLYFFTVSISAQNKRFAVKGTVMDQVSEEPVENANVFIQNTPSGTSTNELGKFTLAYNSLPLILEISHISYETKIITYEFHPIRDLQVILEPSVKKLPQITILFSKNRYPLCR